MTLDMTIREKIGATIALLLMLTATVGGLAIARFEALGGSTREIASNWLPSLEITNRISLDTQRYRALVGLHVLNTEAGRLAGIERDLAADGADVERKREAYRPLIHSAEERAAFDAFGTAWAGYLREVEPILALSRGNAKAEATALLQSRAWPAFDRVREPLDRLLAISGAGAREAARRAEADEASGLVSILGMLGAALLLGVAAAFWILRGIGRDIRRIALPMGRMAEGDVSVDVPKLPARTEMGVMAGALERLAVSLRAAEALKAEQEAVKRRAEEERRASLLGMAGRLETQVGVVVEGIASAATELSNAASSMVQIAESTTRRAAMVGSASATANDEVSAVAAATEQLSASVAEITRQVSESARMASHAVEQSNETAATVGNLTEAAAKIGEVSRLIGDIAAQTNLLALNATIEAARAGEAGKGFAVVASEVKALANQTAQATESITGQIGTMQAATSDAARDLGAIRQSIGRISDVTTAIAAAVEQQGAATRNIAESIQRASGGTNEIAGAIGEVTAAAGETSGAATQVQSTSSALSSQSEVLRREVNEFLQNLRAA